MTPRSRLAALCHTQASLRRLLIDLGDTRSERAIESAITRAMAGRPGGEWLPVVLALLERLAASRQEAA